MLVQSASAGTPDVLAPASAREPLVAERRDAFRAAERPHTVFDPRLIASSRRANSPVKRVFDVIAAFGGLLFLAPALLTIAALIKLGDGGPVFFEHGRVGRYGKMFGCLKFRTMVQDSAGALQRHLAANPAAAQEWRDTQKLTDDPRITPIGRFLRATSLDELPQLINILRGEMSLVGPRPVTKGELDERYARDRRYYLLVRPGLTGLWQVSGRNRVSYARRIELDREYVREWSFLRDMMILFRTIDVVLKRDGAF